jgi:hypothetical protein
LAAEARLLNEHLNAPILHCYWTEDEKADRRYKVHVISNELKYPTYTKIMIMIVKKRN